ncbi:unnamed protein product [Bursaphelenchus xylophilus]|uniref:(pine wood nematode) hypothetical protein n=1 Tax=Bursaphelenchus xylophilus TaxID=6326 RepID=A0A1I7RVC0_BURXY|nr:unnamed protein product [Bursaphelenchus xylophilus]CAG9086659.1 unnamed protein product [Bursaphelenchus xylophilus]
MMDPYEPYEKMLPDGAVPPPPVQPAYVNPYLYPTNNNVVPNQNMPLDYDYQRAPNNQIPPGDLPPPGNQMPGQTAPQPPMTPLDSISPESEPEETETGDDLHSALRASFRQTGFVSIGMVVAIGIVVHLVSIVLVISDFFNIK